MSRKFENCYGCVFSAFHGVPTLDCRRHAPSAHLMEKTWSQGVFPQVEKDHWCGDYELRIDPSS